MNNIIMKLEDIDKFYMETGNKLHILKKLNLEVKRGEFVSILGKSGSGKSTLLNIMGLLDKIDGGKIWIDDKEVSSLNEIERNNIKNQTEIEKEAKELLEIVGLAERMKHKPNQLSGGEKQRVAIARAMINKPKLILADEPTGNLDEDTGELIFLLFRKINKEHNQSIVVVTHARDLSQVTDRQVYLKRGVLE